jgi:integrase
VSPRGPRISPRPKRFQRALDLQFRAQRESGLAEKGPPTVARYFEDWIAKRRERGIASADDDEARVRKHALKVLGPLRLEEVRPQHLRDLVRDLQRTKKDGKQLAPRTVLHVYGVLRVMFSDAVTEELIRATPCVLKQRRGELPKKLDKDSTWRSTAVYQRSEVESLISDPRIPLRRRTLYALEFLAGMRVNEITPRRWRQYEPDLKPLGKLTVATGYNLKKKLEKGTTKTGHTREVPIHPVLARVLADWKLSGWERQYGRAPTPDDLIIPRMAGGGSKHLSSTSALKRLHEDCDLLGIRRRRQHDARRTFISLALADGAHRDLLKWVTHGPEGDIVGAYTTLPWSTLCVEVLKVRVELREGALVSLSGTDAGLLRLATSETNNEKH